MSTPFRAGVNKARMTGFKLVAVSTDKYQGPVLELTFEGAAGESRQERIFPVTPERARETYQQHKEKFGTLTEDDFVTGQFRESTWFISEFLKSYVPGEKVVELHGMMRDYTPEAGNPATNNAAAREAFVKFASMATALLEQEAPAYKQEDRWIVLGFQKNATSLNFPKKPSEGSPILREVAPFAENRFFKLTPWGPKIDAANSSAPPQQSGPVEF